MSGIGGINSNYLLDYSSLFNSASSKSTSAGLDLSKYYGSGYDLSYGTNNSTLSSGDVSSILDYKNAANTLQGALSTLLNKKNDGSSVFGSYKASSSNSDALSVSYENNVGKYSSEAFKAKTDPNYSPETPGDISIKVNQLAKAQQNTSLSLDSKEMALEVGKTYRFELSNGDKTETISFVTEAGDNNESIMKKIASAVNDKDLGITAKVTNTGESNTALTLTSDTTGIKEGQARAFTMRDLSGYDAVSKLGIDNMTTEAQNAKYYVQIDGELESRESMSNTVALTGRTTATLKQTTDDYVDISFKNDSKDGINAVRELVNGFNALYEAASDGSTIQSARLQDQLQGLAKTYGSSLADVGITRNENGYFVINEDKMQEAADSGALEKIFSADDKATNYGFAKRLQNIANSVADNPNQYVSGKKTSEAKNSEDYWSEFSQTSPASYSKLLFSLQRYENMGALFNSMF